MDAPFRARGITLVELVTVILVMSVLAFTAVPRLRTSDSGLMASRDTIIAALSHAQQIAMARDSVANPVTVMISSNSIDVRENGISVSSPGAAYPFTLPSGVLVSAGLGEFHYDKLGRSAPRIISLNDGQATITLEASGYAY